MATDWVVLPSGRTYDWGSGSSITPDLEVHQFGNARSARFVNGTNYHPRSFSVVYHDIDSNDFGTLLGYCRSNDKGGVLNFPNLLEGLDGSFINSAYILSYSWSANYLYTFTINLMQVYTST